MRDQIVEGCASILWALSWADHAEEAECTSLLGADICDLMPPIPDVAYMHAGRIIGATEQASDMQINALLWACLRADGLDPEACWQEHAGRFGECLAFMALGHGVSWYDDHEECPALNVPYTEAEMLAEAAEACCGETP